MYIFNFKYSIGLKGGSERILWLASPRTQVWVRLGLQQLVWIPVVTQRHSKYGKWKKTKH